ncbi:unnamed protein product [Arabis nemorensis]|uniref:Uncharacterized protein n=1 Tax=Arabis nemorensis TaxID=586526 RepID=A0A565CAR4_9BRAS|nr:unnamed protein product [Arabis nemorensis]
MMLNNGSLSLNTGLSMEKPEAYHRAFGHLSGENQTRSSSCDHDQKTPQKVTHADMSHGNRHSTVSRSLQDVFIMVSLVIKDIVTNVCKRQLFGEMAEETERVNCMNFYNKLSSDGLLSV